MLGVPPAFVLSQDQTLYEVCILKPFGFTIFLIPIHYDCSQLPRSCLKLNTDFTLLEIYKGFVLIALFNFQDTIFRCPASALSNFIIISYSFRFVKYFFKNSWKLFEYFKLLTHFSVFSNLFIISHFPSFVKLFSENFRNSFFSRSTFIPLFPSFACLPQKALLL